jgi:protein-S-isoprenylcysteine O-methyltransferase Ste14
MDPEIYVFPKINSAPLKIAFSTGLFILVFLVARVLITLLPGPHLWSMLDRSLTVGIASVRLACLTHIVIGYGLFIYGSYHAWRATRQKNTVEDSKHELAMRILDTDYYGRVRHPMYGMFMMANVGLGFAMNSVYGLLFALLSVILFIANGIFEEKYIMLRFFAGAYRDYMHRVKRRFFTPAQAMVVSLALALYTAGLFF